MLFEKFFHSIQPQKVNKLPCHYAVSGINYKNGFVTTCAIQTDYLHKYKSTTLPSKFINNPNFKQFRLQLARGEWPAGCHMCAEVEHENSSNSMRFDYKYDETHYHYETGEIDFESIKIIELRFSNSCNMACLHCSQVYSSGWMSKLKHYTPTQQDHELHLDQLTGAMHRRDPDEDFSIELSITDIKDIVEDLNKNFPNIERVEFAGGEVLHQKQFFPCLKLLAQHPNSKNIFVSFHSNFNANFDPKELSQLLEPFGESLIHMSIDSGKNIYPYFRGGDWGTLVNNINTFRSVNNFTRLGAVCTTSVYQVMDIQNVFESLLSLDIDEFHASLVYTPEYLNPTILMLHFKDDVLTDIENTYAWLQQYPIGNLKNEALDSLHKIKTYVTTHKPASTDKWPNGIDSHYKSFMHYITVSDKLWKQNFNDYITNYKYNNNEITRIR
jgi:MoaA/NifB/PqqE/SkfB family radical SAM enzyme